MFLCFSVDEQTVTRTDTVTGLVNKSVDYLGLSFTFKSEGIWDNLDKKIEFYNGEIGVYDLELDNEDKVTVPFEVLTGDYFIFSLYGVSGDLRVTTNRVKVYLKESGFIGDGVAPSDDKRTVIERINDRIDGVVVDVSALESTVSGHTSSLSNLSDDVTGLTGSLQALSVNVNAIGDDVTSLENIVTGHTRSLDGLARDMDSIGDDVDNLESTVNGIGDDITAINGKLNNTVEMTVEYTDGTTQTFDVVVK